MGKLRENMRPEFINRIDEIVLFRKLDRDQLRQIVRVLLRATQTRLAPRDVTLTVTDAAVEWIADHGYEPEFGARPLRRVIQREVDDRIADLLVSGAIDDGGAIHVDAAEGELLVSSRERMSTAA
jgi:ATP-dependent Clp protease ATP-binding subunit ClpC